MHSSLQQKQTCHSVNRRQQIGSGYRRATVFLKIVSGTIKTGAQSNTNLPDNAENNRLQAESVDIKKCVVIPMLSLRGIIRRSW